jgi:hypothetical protein
MPKTVRKPSAVPGGPYPQDRTAEQYIQRLLGYLAGRDALKIQAATPGRIARLIRGVPRRRLLRPPAPGKWSIGEIIAHLADDEIVGAWRIRRILEVPGGPLDSFDQDKWAEAGRYARRDPSASLDLFCALRQANLAFYKSLAPTQRRLFGIHAERGKESIESIFQLYAGHDLNHLQQIQAILGKPSAR